MPLQVEDDAFINETREHWYFGRDNSGDMRLPINIAGTWEKIKEKGPVMLVTADGSIDCSGAPDEQEAMVAQLHFCEAVAALGALDKGGSFVLKMFTLGEHSSICLVYLLSCFFDETSVCKPTMSTPGNSETYIVCKGFRGISEEYKLALLKHTGPSWPQDMDGQDLAIIPRSFIATSWLEHFVQAAKYFAELQGAVIKRNLRLFDEFSPAEGRRIHQARHLIVTEWMRRYRIFQIHPGQRIAGKRLTGAGGSNRIGGEGAKRKRDEGNLAERWAKKEDRASVRGGEVQLEDFENLVTDERAVKRQKTTETKESYVQISDFARRQMEKMGHKEGAGLGKDGTGIQEPIEATSKLQGDRKGLDVSADGASSLRVLEASDIYWIDGRELEKRTPAASLSPSSSWFQQGSKLSEYKMSKFCHGDMVLELLRRRPAKAKLEPSTWKKLFACYSVPCTNFVSRAGMKLADVVKTCSWALDKEKGDGLALFGVSDSDKVSFLDMHGGRGGCTDYLLWRLRERVKVGWILRREDKEGVTLDALKSRSLFSSPPPLSPFPEDAEAVNVESLADMEKLVSRLESEASRVNLVIGDTIIRDLSSRTDEIASIPSLLAQVWTATGVLARSGTLICRISDSLGRCMVGAMYVLARCFERITIVKPTLSCPAKSERYLVCVGYAGVEATFVSELRAHLRAAMQRMKEREDGMDLLEIVPTGLLLQNPFFDRVVKYNQKYGKEEAAALRYLEEATERGEADKNMDEAVKEVSAHVAAMMAKSS